MKASLYIHIPFCARKCAYCDFESYAGRLDSADDYITRVISEAADAKKRYGINGVPTVFIGGGTPSMLSSEQIRRLLGEIADIFEIDKDAEFTMEMNPGTVNREKLLAAKCSGVNRVSYGVQALQDSLLKILGRIHDFDDAVSSVKLAQDMGLVNINCDVMYALPSQEKRDLIETVDGIDALGVKHISCYSLILEEGTPLYGQVESGKLNVPDEDYACGMQEVLLKELRRLGYERYEISNYSKSGYESRHNTVYWTGGSYLGLGCAAHSFIDGVRSYNPEFAVYMSGIDHTETERVTEEGMLEEKLLLGTRMTKGVDISDFGYKAETLIKEASKPKYKGLVQIKDGWLSFTDDGLMVHNALVLEFVNAIS